MTTIQTFTGVIDLANPQADMIQFQDIVIGLANQPRYGGQTGQMYTVAQHSIRVANLVGDPDLTLEARLHDAHESVYGDIPTPLKRILGPAYTDLTDQYDRALCEKLNLGPLDHPRIKDADMRALHMERFRLGLKDPAVWGHYGDMEIPSIHPLLDRIWDPIWARDQFGRILNHQLALKANREAVA